MYIFILNNNIEFVNYISSYIILKYNIYVMFHLLISL